MHANRSPDTTDPPVPITSRSNRRSVSSIGCPVNSASEIGVR